MAWLQRLKERGVLRVAVSYALIAWLLLQIADVTFEPLGVPRWVMVTLIITAVLGFPVAAALAWFYEVGDQGHRARYGARGSRAPHGKWTAAQRGHRHHRRAAGHRRIAAGAAVGPGPFRPGQFDDRCAALSEPERLARTARCWRSASPSRCCTRSRTSRNSTSSRERRRSHFADHAGDSREIGRQLGARYLLEGQCAERRIAAAGHHAIDRYRKRRRRLVDAIRPADGRHLRRCRTRSPSR